MQFGNHDEMIAEFAWWSGLLAAARSRMTPDQLAKADMRMGFIKASLAWPADYQCRDYLGEQIPDLLLDVTAQPAPAAPVPAVPPDGGENIDVPIGLSDVVDPTIPRPVVE